ncbi:MAG: hypothetical protein Q9227_002732 [Pyrenula ochraceoflavens]
MDAKPQRLRNIRVPGDENVAPNRAKTIHQRNKSSPALSTMATIGGLKVAAKRTAFGDVSNTANGPRHIKDDSIVAIKEVAAPLVKGTTVLNERKPQPLSQPAQRPVTVSKSLRTLLTGASSSNTSSSTSEVDTKQPVINNAKPAPQEANTRKTLSKRSTTIFKDPGPVIAQETSTTAPITQRAPLQQIINLGSNALPAILGQSQKINPPPFPSDPSSAEDENLPRNGLLSTTEEQEAVRSDGVCIDELEHSQRPEKPDEIPLPYPAAIQASTIPSAVETELVQISEAKRVGERSEIDRVPSRYSHPLPSEPEEYWEDEDEENYGEDGYVTARSFRSRGDNTTGPATTLLIPYTTKSVRRELDAAKRKVLASKTQDEEEDEEFDTSMVAQYSEEIFDYLQQLEIRMLPAAHYMDNQAEISWSMRSVLMDWLIQVHHRFGLLPETLFLAVNYIDRFLSCKVVSLGKLQLVGATAIFIAAKYEEINCPSVQEIMYMVDGGYTIDEILKAERFMLSMLQFELGWPGPMSFLRRISKADDYDLETRTLAKYFLEVTVMDERFVASPPSFTSAAAHCLSRMILQKGPWSQNHVFYSGYTFSQLYPLLQILLECCERPAKHHAAVFEKYCDKRYKRASLFVETEIRKGFVLPLPREGSLRTSFVNPIDGSTWYPI